MSAASKAGIHAAAGAASGAINAAITGGDVGKEALIGALSAGVSKYTGVDNFAGRTAIGAGTGGVSSLMYGGDFAEGAIQGAMSSAIAYVCNDLSHLKESLEKGLNEAWATIKEAPKNAWDAIYNEEVGEALLTTGGVVVGTKAFVGAKALAIYVATTNPHVAKDGWHFLKLGYHSIGKTVITRNLGHLYEAGKYLHLNVANRHFILIAGKIMQQIKYWKYLK